MESLRDTDLEYLETLHKRLRSQTDYLRPSARKTLRLALEIAFLAHMGQLRRSGEPYISHPVEVARLLAQTQVDKGTVVSGLLHDTVEDTDLSLAEVESFFGAVVAKIVEGETKVSKLPKMARNSMERDDLSDLQQTTKAEEQVENMRSMFIAMAEDWRIVVVKLADRLHNMRTLQHMPAEKRASIARETLEIFAPLAHRLGMWQYKTELADLSFKHLFPSEYEQLDAAIRSKFDSYTNDTLQLAQSELEGLLQADQWMLGRLRSVSVTGRTKSIYSTWKKMQKHECSIERIHDLVALRVVLNPEPSPEEEASDDDETTLCYHVLGKVHASWTPLPRTLKDYISSPKPNGYRSLHTTVVVGTQPLEIQIRTQAMHHVAEYGAAAHWAYKDRSASLPWLQIVRKWEQQAANAHEFMQLVRQELLGTRVFVFSANGRIINLARGATLADAVALLSRHPPGLTMLNGAAAPHNTQLQNGDIVSFVDSHSDTTGGSELRGLAADESRPMRAQEKARRYVLHKSLRASNAWHACPECMPLLGDELVGVTDGPLVVDGADAPPVGNTGGMVHRVGCGELLAAQAVEGPQLLETEDAAQLLDDILSDVRASTGGLLTSIIAYCRDRRGMLLDVSTAVTREATNIVNVNSEIYRQGADSAFQYRVMVQDVAHLRRLMGTVETVPDVTGVARGELPR